LEKLQETSLPPKESFQSKLNNLDISQKDYTHACKVWTEMGFKTLGEYSDFYVILDVTLLCDIMEEFRNTCKSAYGLDPLHSYTSPGLSWQAMMKETKCELQLLTDIDMVLMIESAVRGGLTQSVKRYVKANNKYMSEHDPSKESVYLGYFDANNLYGYAMSKPLPSGNFEWVNPDSVGDILQIPLNGEVGYILECDFEYPET
ncbi:DNA polymerase, partial [Klebsiella pneumoniae]|uniref:DNA polymerase n=1 Tax=Klebsiella pneumoniae TaxID=573 RepID=UPI00117B6C45